MISQRGGAQQPSSSPRLSTGSPIALQGKAVAARFDGGWLSSLTSGEGLVCRFRGPGRVLIQTRNPGGFGAWVRQFIPKT